MKKKIFLILTMVAIFALVLAFGVSAATYNYYENEIKDENLLYTAETMVAKDFKSSGQQTRYEAIRQDSGKGFAKYDANGKPLTWYVVSETVLYDASNKYIGKNIIVASTLTNGGAGTIDGNGLYTFGSGTVEGLTAGQVVSANFFGLEIRSFVENAFMADVSDTDRQVVGTFYTGTWGKEYACVAAPGSYLNFLYLPKTLETISNRFCYRSPLRVLEFENNKIEATFIPKEAFSFCGSLKNLVIPEGITEIEAFVKIGDFEYAPFRECLSLEFLKLPDSLTSVPDNVFYRCVSIHTVIYGEYTTYIGRLSTAYGRFGFGDSKLDNVNMKYIYVPNLYVNNIESGIAEADMIRSQFDQYRGLASNNSAEAYVDKTNNIVFFFDGSLAEAKLAGNFCADLGGHFRIALGDATHNTLKPACAPVDYATYILNKEYYDNLEGYLVVYNGDYCDECHGEKRYNEVLTYPNGFMKNGIKGHACVSCGFVTEIVGEIEALFTAVGYSKSEVNYDAIMVGFTVNKEAIDNYKQNTGYEFSYGLFAAKSAKLGDNTIFDENGNVNEGAAVVEMSQRQYSVIELKVKGIDTYKKRSEALIMGGYVKVNNGESEELSYLQAVQANEGEIYSTVRLLDYLTPEQAGAVKVDQKDEGVDYIIDADALFGNN